MFGLVHCNASIIARQNTDPNLYFVRMLMKNWLWPIITFFGVTGNILAIIVLAKRRMILSSTNNYLIALAIVDIAYLILTLIINTLQNPCFIGTSLSEIVLTICRPIADFSSNTSVWLTITFTVERWVAITYPLQSRTWCTVNRARRIVLSVILASLICTLPSAFETKLVRIIERKNVSNTIIYASYIKAKPTVLGSSLLYHQIYFNFVTFVIIWIPLLILIIFNTILVISVRRSKQHEQQNSDGTHLRRHNHRSSHSEQRKITIMLIAVVIVFTVCQIPQAISLTVQSFFPVFAQTSKVLIYNNFANCLVAINASINFLLYCFFSDRFRSNFICLNKYYSNVIENKSDGRRTTEQQIRFNSFDNTSLINQSYNSLHGSQCQQRISNHSLDINPKYFHHIIRAQSQTTNNNLRSWFTCLSNLSSKWKLSRNNNNQLQLQRLSQSTDSCPSSPTISTLRSPLIVFNCQELPSNSSASGERIFKLSIDDTASKPILTGKRFSVTLTNHDLLQSDESNGIVHCLRSPSYQSFINKNQNPQRIWIQHNRTDSTDERMLTQEEKIDSKDFLDASV